MLRHNLDGMHTEKNNFEDLFYIIMDISEKTKYNDNAHIDEAQLCNLDEDEGPRVRITLSCELDTIKFTGLKNHDCHVVMELLLPVAFRDFLPNEVREPLTKLSIFFKELFGTEIDPILLAQLEKKCDFHHMQVREQQFPDWFQNKVLFNHELDSKIKNIGLGPFTKVHCYNEYDINEYRFHTHSHSANKSITNSGICVKGEWYDDTE
jgi:hypothetical protein